MTKVIVIGLQGATIEQLLGDQRLVNFRRLAESGCYGTLTGIADVEGSTATEETFASVKAAVPPGDFSYIQFQLHDDPKPAMADYCLRLDHDLGLLLETLSDDTILLLLSIVADVGQGAFILSAANLPTSGHLSDASIHDLPPTLLDLLGIEIPAEMHARSLIKGHATTDLDSDNLSDEARQLLLDRLSGLGYI